MTVPFNKSGDVRMYFVPKNVALRVETTSEGVTLTYMSDNMCEPEYRQFTHTMKYGPSDTFNYVTDRTKYGLLEEHLCEFDMRVKEFYFLLDTDYLDTERLQQYYFTCNRDIEEHGLDLDGIIDLRMIYFHPNNTRKLQLIMTLAHPWLAQNKYETVSL